MRLAALYDIHGNLPALEAVLEEARRDKVDRIVVGGDVVPGPMPRETLDCLLALEVPVHFLAGNGEREVLAIAKGGRGESVPEAFREGMRWNAQQLRPDHEQLLAGWPPSVRLPLEGIGETLFCHATPRSDAEIFTRLTPEERLLQVFEGVGASLVVCGHTHMQFDRRIGKTRVVNAGSVGMPFGEPGGDWLLLGAGVQLRHTPYDLPKAAARIRATSYPQSDYFAAHHLLTTPSEASMLEMYGKAELK